MARPLVTDLLLPSKLLSEVCLSSLYKVASSAKRKRDILFLVADTRLYTLPCRSVGPSVRPVTFLNFERFLHYCSRPTVRDCIAVYPALFYFLKRNKQKVKTNSQQGKSYWIVGFPMLLLWQNLPNVVLKRLKGIATSK